MAIDGTVNIDIQLNNGGQQFISDIKHISQLLSDLGTGSGDKMNAAFTDNAKKVTDQATKVHDQVTAEMAKDVQQDVNVKANIEDFNRKSEQVERKKAKNKQSVITKTKGNNANFDRKARETQRQKRRIKQPVSVRIKADLQKFSHNVHAAGTQLHRLKEQGQKVRGIFAGSFLGSFFGNAAASGISLLVQGIKSAGTAAIDYDKQLQTVKATWKTLTGSAKEGKKMTDMTLEMAAAANNSIDMVQDLNAKLYSVTDSAGRTKGLTNAILTLQDAFGQTDDAVKGFTTQWSQMEANGKVQAQDMMSFVNVFPKIRTELLNTMRQQTGHHDMTMQQMNDLMSDGKISSDVMDKVLLKMQKDYANASTTFAQTLDGLGRTVKSRAPALLGELTAPFLDKTVNPIMKGIAGWFSDSDTNELFKKESVKLSKGLDYMLNSIKKAFNMHGDINDFLNSSVAKFSNKMTAIFNWVGNHAKDIKNAAASIISIAKAFGSGVWSAVAGSLKVIARMFNILTGHKTNAGGAIHSVADALKAIASHQKALETIGKMWGTYWVASKFFGIAKGIGAIAGSLSSVYRAGKSLIGKGNGKNTTGMLQDIKNQLGKVKDKFKGEKIDVPVNADTKQLTSNKTKSKVSAGGTAIGKALTGAMGAVLVGFDIYQAFTAKSSKKRWRAIGGGIGTALGGGIGAFFGGPAGAAIGMSIGQYLGQKAGPAIKKSLESFWNPPVKAKKGTKKYYQELAKKYRTTAQNFQKNTPGFGPGSKNIQKEIDKYNHLADAAEKSAKRVNRASKSTQKKKKKTTTSEAIEDIAVVHVSKTDIKNVKAMIPAMKQYKSALKGLKRFLKKNDPSQKIKKINENISSNTKGWGKLARPIKKIGSAFKTLASFSKSMGKHDAFAQLNEDLPKLKQTLKDQEIGSQLKKIGNSIKDSKIIGRLKKLTNSIDKDTKKWKKFAKPVKTVGKAFKNLTKFLNVFGKNDPFEQLTKDITDLTTAMDKKDIGSKFKSLTKTLKDNNPAGQLRKMNTQVKTATKRWQALAKPLKTVNKAFNTLLKFTNKIGGKNDPLAKLNADFGDLKTTLTKTNIGNLLQDQMDAANAALGKKNTGFVGRFGSMVKSIKQDLKSFKSSFTKNWKKLWNNAYDNLDKANGRIDRAARTHNSTMRDIQNGFHSAYLKSEKGWLNSVVSKFQKAFGKLPTLAYNSLSKVIGYINGGISGIDYVIGKFGGPKSLIKPIKFASGTNLLNNGRLTRPTIATLNDGSDSPETNNVERVVHADGSSYEPSGRFATQMLLPGDGVLNASENRILKEMHYFAAGTGVLDAKMFKGINGSGQVLINLAERLNKHIKKSFNLLFGKQPKIKGKVQNAFKSIFNRETKGQGNKWWATVWSLINETIGSGDASGLLAAVEKYGHGRPYVWGATGPDSFDCSGLVMYSLKKAFGILYPRVSGDQINKAKRISAANAKPGDLLGNAEHIGVYAGNGKYYSAMSPTSTPNIGMSSVSSFPGTPKWGRVAGIKSPLSNKKSSINQHLRTFVKNQLGTNMFSWIRKHLAPLEATAGTASGGTVSGNLIRKAAKIAGVSLRSGDMARIQNVIQHESNGSATIVNRTDSNARAGHPSKGILQFIDSTFQHYALPGHKNILSALDQLVAMFNDTTWRSDLTLGGWSPNGTVRHVNGGWGTPGMLNTFNELPDEPEVAINPARSSADQLLKETIQKRIERDPNSYFAKAAKVISVAKQHAQGLHQNVSLSRPVQSAKTTVNSDMTSSGNTTINFVADGQTLASVIYPKQKLMQQKDITIAAKKGGLH